MKLSACLECLQDNLLQASSTPEIDVLDETADSRLIKEGSLFVAIRGSLSNGEDFIPQAISKGCTAVISQSSLELECPSILVKDTYLAVSQLAEVMCDSPAASMNLIGITGTNGKSSIAMMINWLFIQAGIQCGLSGTIETSYAGKTFPSKMTTPDALSFQKLLMEMKAHGVEEVVLEVSSHALSQHRVGTIPFKTAIFTNLTQDHLDYHDDMDAYFDAKTRLFTELLEGEGVAIINIDDQYGRKLANHLDESRSITVSQKEGDVVISDIKCDFEGTSFCLEKEGEKYNVISPLLGEFNVMNLAQAILAVEQRGVSVESSIQLLANFPGVPGRMQIFRDEQKMAIVDYAHTPDALEKALKCLRPLTSELHCLFGCGGDRDSGKRPLMAQAAQQFSDFVWLTDDNPRTEDRQKILSDIQEGFESFSSLKVEPDRKKCIRQAWSKVSKNGILLIAGKGHEDYQIYGTTKQAFCDRQVIQELINEHN